MRSVLVFACVLALAGCSTFTVEADASRQVTGDWRTTIEGRDFTHEVLVRVAAGFEPALSETLTMPLGVEHRSYPSTTADRGEERVYLGLKWRPFVKDAP
ncbi:MAG: hypothetical protein IRZ28_11710 [Steroidobacteraceae bacterium]|nr:hypothetical protein [Steroidobacteraceae bacterium]